MSFIAMAVPVGPWIDVTLVLLGMFFVRLFFKNISVANNNQILGYSTGASAIGGSVATACGFAFPTLYFLNPKLFVVLLNNPANFIILIAMLIISAGGLGMLIAHIVAPSLLADSSMTFPIGQMAYSLMTVGNSIRKAYELIAGLAMAFVVNIAQLFTDIVPEKIIFLKKIALGYFIIPSVILRSDWVLMLLAIGFVTGHVIAIPLAIGVLIKFFAADPLQQTFFCNLAVEDFFFAFCSGIVLQSTFMSMIELPNYILTFFKKNSQKSVLFDGIRLDHLQGAILASFLLLTIFFLWSLNFSFISQIYLLFFTSLCTYQIAIIGGKTGLAPIGRFATWVMVPFLMLFGFDALQVTIVATFVEISGMVVVDTLFGRKMAQLASLDNKKMALYQVGGLVLSAVTVGIVFWLLISHFGLGATSPLIAQRCQARALLIKASYFDYMVMFLGIACGFVLKFIKINSTLVIGGLLLPIDFSLLLIFGGLSTYLVKDIDAYTPFWSGVFAASALFMLLKTLL
ncbi:MAG: hypothetical protein K2X90_02790 [Candidatus Babeliaceae bacterium]|nr:hypothetical protein [Candidatus Babeliaceae bacterium]